jgi:hypothetical protein
MKSGTGSFVKRKPLAVRRKGIRNLQNLALGQWLGRACPVGADPEKASRPFESDVPPVRTPDRSEASCPLSGPQNRADSLDFPDEVLVKYLEMPGNDASMRAWMTTFQSLFDLRTYWRKSKVLLRAASQLVSELVLANLFIIAAMEIRNWAQLMETTGARRHLPSGSGISTFI